MKNCPNCGQEVQEDGKFCEHCGEKLEGMESASTETMESNTVEGSDSGIEESKVVAEEPKTKHPAGAGLFLCKNFRRLFCRKQ